MWRRPHVRAGTARAWQFARQQFAAVVNERNQLRQDLVGVRQQRDQALDLVRELRVCIQERWRAEERCRELYREREIGRARAAERDPAQPLH
jgi:hypothetical protein